MSGDAGARAGEWFHKAEDDVMSVLKEGGAPSTACFLAQQIAEKYLKGMLVYQGKSFPKVHDLLELETNILERAPDIKMLHDDLAMLNRYYIETRYPGSYPEFHMDEAKAAFNSALKVKEMILKLTGIQMRQDG